MIDFIRGAALEKDDLGRVVIDCGVFGLECLVPTTDLEKVVVGEKVVIYSIVKISVESGAMKAVGSVDRGTRDLLVALLELPGVGSKVALSIISHLGAAGASLAIASGDVEVLSQVPGLGAKSAAKIILNGRGKSWPMGDKSGVSKVAPKVLSEIQKSVVSALSGMGWKEDAAVARVLQVTETNPSLDVSGALRACLLKV